MATTLVWLFTLTLPDGTVYKAATRPTKVTSIGGTPHAYDLTLTSSPTYVEEVDLFSLDASASFQQAQISFLTTADFAALMADWRWITSSRGELAVLINNATYEDRRILLADGRVQNLQVGLSGEKTTLVLEGIGALSGATIGGDSTDLGDVWTDPLTDTVAASVSSLVGRKRIFVYGNPNRVPAYKVGDVGGTDRLVLCGHVLPNLGTVLVYEDAGAGFSFIPATTANTGGDYSYVTSATAFRGADGGYTWDASRGGINAADDLTSPALRASGVLERLLVDSGEVIDWRSMEETLMRLDRFQCGFWVDEEVGALDLIRERMVPVFPLVEVMGPHGLYFAYSDPHVREPEVVLTEGQQLKRLGRMTFSDADATFNEFTVNYDYNAQAGTYEGAVTIDKDNDAVCYLAHQLAQSKTRAAKILKTAAIKDKATAYAVLRAQASRLALQRRQLTYLAALDVLEQVRAGQVFTLNSPTWGISNAKAVIRSITYAEPALTLQVDLIDRTFNSRR